MMVRTMKNKCDVVNDKTIFDSFSFSKSVVERKKKHLGTSEFSLFLRNVERHVALEEFDSPDSK